MSNYRITMECFHLPVSLLSQLLRCTTYVRGEVGNLWCVHKVEGKSYSRSCGQSNKNQQNQYLLPLAFGCKPLTIVSTTL